MLQFTENRQRSTGLATGVNRRAVITTIGARGPQGVAGVVQSVVAGDHVTVDDTDPANPIVAAGDFEVADITGLAADLDAVSPRTSVPLYAQTIGWDFVPSGETLVDIGGFTVTCAFGFGSLWAACTDPPSVVRIDPTTGTVLATISAGTNPTNLLNGICCSDDAVWVSDYTAGRVGRVDPLTNTISFPAGLAIGSTLRGLVFDGTFVWVAVSIASGLVKKINPATNTIAATVAVGNLPSYPCWDGANHLWVPNFSSDNVSRVHITNHTVDETVVTLGNPQFAFCNGARVYVGEYGNDSVASYTVGRTNPIGARWSVAATAGVHGIVVVDDQLWVCQSNLNQIQVVNIHDGTIIKTIPAGVDPAGICFDGRDIWTVDAVDATLRRHSMRTTWVGGVS